MKKKILALLLAGGMILATGCGKTEETAATEPAAEDTATTEEPAAEEEAPKEITDPQELIEVMKEANTADNIFSLYHSVTCNESQPIDETSEAMVTYYSASTYYYVWGDDEAFCYCTKDRMVGSNPDSEGPYYSLVCDESEFTPVFDSYMNIHYFNTDGYEATIVEPGVLQLTSENDEYTYNYDTTNYLIQSYTFKFASDDNLWLSAEYTYSDEDRDQELSDKIDEYVEQVSGGKTVKVTINDLDDKTYEFDMPSGMIAAIYAKGEHFTMENGEYFYEQALTEDTVLTAAE